MNQVTADEVKNAMIASGITQVDNHECAGCSYMTAYLRRGDLLFFDRGCDCTGYRRNLPEPRSWQSAADWINMQTRENVRAKVAARFGLAAQPTGTRE